MNAPVFRLASVRRPGWDEYFLNIAVAVSARSSCTRDKIGAVIVVDNRIVATGYNDAPSGEPGCQDAPCPRSLSDVPSESPYDSGAGRCVAVHAEVNAILDIGTRACFGATLYVTRRPCPACKPIIISANFSKIAYLLNGKIEVEEEHYFF